MSSEFDEIEINLIAVLWRMAAQWKLVVLTGFVVGLSVSIYFFWSDSGKSTVTLESENTKEDSSTDSASTTSDPSTATDSSLSISERRSLLRKLDVFRHDNEKETKNNENEAKEPEITHPEVEQVEILVKKQEQYEKIQDYTRNSILYQVDPFNMRKLVLRYAFKVSAGTSAGEAGALLVSDLLSQPSVCAISDALKNAPEEKYLRELISISYVGNDFATQSGHPSNEGCIDISVILPKNEEEDRWSQAIRDQINYYATSEPVIRDNGSIHLINEHTETIVNNELLTVQSDALAKEQSVSTELRASVNGFSDPALAYYSRLLEKKGLNTEYVKDEKKKRDDITEEIRMANAAALEASTAAVKAKEAAATAASKALQAEEQVELASAKAEEAAVLATRAVLEEKMKKAQSATLNQDRMIAETKEYAATVTSQAEKALLASQEAQEAATKSQEAAAAAESAAAEVNTAIELRQQARKVSEIAAEAATTAQTKAEEAQTASQAADIAVDVAEAANQNAKAQSAKAEAENAADIAESATGSRDGDSKETSWKSAAGQPVFSFSKLILGGFAGVFFYGIMMVMYFILHPCVNEETCSAMLSDRRTLRLRELRDPKGKERFFYDVHVYRWMMRNVPVLNQQIDDIVSAFRFYAQKDGVTDFTLLAVGDLTVTAQKLEQALVQRTQDEVFTLKTEVLTEPNTRSFYEQMDRISNVFLVSEYDMTGVPMLRKAMVSLEECDVKQEGHIVLN